MDHSVLLQRVQQYFGLIGAVLQWLTSFLNGRTQQMIYDGRLSLIQRVCCDVVQGSVLVPLLFIIYSAGVSKYNRQPRLPSIPLCRRHPSLLECSSRRCVIRDLTTIPLCCRRYNVVQLEPATSEPGKDSTHLVGVETASGES